ncbi:hypothetical protein J1792_12530 [Streptomyces triculaminicus]|uniref:Uncharacterized protein n=1 Tax=Streptomyces triculaminicus TaxID=2816232 RepID=A0A939JRG2_9ACTN|nr:hypothetical protein [Streptomyces triculaminicus]MBO0653579.1 hypothetical protein [Streptomyces triculaminicus]
MIRTKLIITGAAVAVGATIFAATAASADPVASASQDETTAIAFREVSAEPEKVVDGEAAPAGWGSFAAKAAGAFIGNAAWEGAKQVDWGAPARKAGDNVNFRRGGAAAHQETSGNGLSRAFD